MRCIVLGGGRVGGAIARDLADDFSVTVADMNPQVIAGFSGMDEVGTDRVDVTDFSSVKKAVAGYDLVVGAVPGHLGFETLRSVIECGKNVVDISFFAEDPFQLDALARDKGVTVVVDCGVAPGLSNLVLGHWNATLDEVESFACYVGGLPQRREPPWEYKAPFSPVDVIEEYTRPARLVRDGAVITLPALSESEIVDFEGAGPLEAFNTDGLRTLVSTMQVPDMKEKTLRYPGHIDKIATLRDAGLFGVEPVTVNGTSVCPRDLTSQLLFEQWRYGDGDRDLTVMRIVVEGRKNGNAFRVQHDLLDRYDEQSSTSSMARTTGYTCTAVARLLANGRYGKPGISPPEYVGADGDCFEFVLAELASRGIVLGVRTL